MIKKLLLTLLLIPSVANGALIFKSTMDDADAVFNPEVSQATYTTQGEAVTGPVTFVTGQYGNAAQVAAGQAVWNGTLKFRPENFDFADVAQDGGRIDVWVRFDADPGSYPNKHVFVENSGTRNINLELTGTPSRLMFELYGIPETPVRSSYDKFRVTAGSGTEWDNVAQGEWHLYTMLWRKNGPDHTDEMWYYIDGILIGNDFSGNLPEPSAIDYVGFITVGDITVDEIYSWDSWDVGATVGNFANVPFSEGIVPKHPLTNAYPRWAKQVTWTNTPDYQFQVHNDLASTCDCDVYVDGNLLTTITATNDEYNLVTPNFPLSNANHTWQVKCDNDRIIGPLTTFTVSYNAPEPPPNTIEFWGSYDAGEEYGVLGKGWKFNFNTIGKYTVIPGLTDTDGSYTVSAWLYHPSIADTTDVFWETGSNTATAYTQDNSQPRYTDPSNAVDVTWNKNPIDTDSWHYWSFVYSASDSLLNVYYDGALLTPSQSKFYTNELTLNNNINIGVLGPATYDSTRLRDGYVDELTISSEPKSSDWALVTYRNQSDMQGFFGVTGVDLTAPTLQGIAQISDNALELQFSEEVEQNSAETIGNYSILPTKHLISAVKTFDKVTLTYQTNFNNGFIYDITINNLRDLAANIIANNTSIGFEAKVPFETYPTITEVQWVSDSVIRITFSEDMDEPSVESSTSSVHLYRWDGDSYLDNEISPTGTLTMVNTYEATLNMGASSRVTDSWYIFTADNNTMESSVGFYNNQKLTVFFEEGTSGLPQPDLGDTTPPTMVSVDIPDITTVEATFSEPLNITSAENTDNWLIYKKPLLEIADPGNFPGSEATDSHYASAFNNSDSQNAPPKITAIDPVSDTVTFSGNWPQGSWEIGYYNVVGEFDFINTPHSSGNYWGSRPQIRRSPEFGRGHLLIHMLNPSLNPLNEAIADSAVKFLIDEQRVSGAWVDWIWRPDQTTPNLPGGPVETTTPGNDNRESPFSTGRALAYIGEVYAKSVDEGGSWPDPYYETPMIDAVNNLLSDSKLDGNHSVSGSYNYNYHGTSLYAFASAYKTLSNRPSGLYNKIEALADSLVSHQRVGGIADGMWYFCTDSPADTLGGYECGFLAPYTIDTVDGGDGAEGVPHDSKANYHSITTRGLISAYQVLDEGDLKDRVRDAVVRAINHIIEDILNDDGSLQTHFINVDGDPVNTANAAISYFDQDLGWMLGQLAQYVENRTDFSPQDYDRLMAAVEKFHQLPASRATSRYWMGTYAGYDMLNDPGSDDRLFFSNYSDFSSNPITPVTGETEVIIAESDFTNMHNAAESIRNPPIITFIDVAADTVGTSGTWGEGAWEWGYFNDTASWYDTPTGAGNYWASRPRARRVMEIGGAYMWTDLLGYSYGNTPIDLIGAGVDYLKNNQLPDGEWADWIYRYDRTTPTNSDMGVDLDDNDLLVGTSTTHNRPYHFSAMSAIDFISKAYVQKIKAGTVTAPDTTYTNPISRGLTYLMGSDFDPTNPSYEGPWANDGFNSNYFVTVAFAMVSAHNADNTLAPMSEIERYVDAYCDAQIKSGDYVGMWPQADRVDTFNGQDFYHDTRSVYHVSITARLSRIFPFLPRGDVKDKLRVTLRLAWNHIINNILNTDGSFDSFYIDVNGDPPNPTNATATEKFPEGIMGASFMALNAKQDANFTDEERDTFLNVAHRVAGSVTPASSYWMKAFGTYEKMKEMVCDVCTVDEDFYFSNYQVWDPPGVQISSISAADSVVTITTDVLEETTTYYVESDNIADLNGNYAGIQTLQDVSPPVTDPTPPVTLAAFEVSKYQFKVVFNENLNQGSAENTLNYIMYPENLPSFHYTITNASLNVDEVTLTISEDIFIDGSFSIDVSNIQDVSGNAMQFTETRTFNLFRKPAGYVSESLVATTSGVVEATYDENVTDISSTQYTANVAGSQVSVTGQTLLNSTTVRLTLAQGYSDGDFIFVNSEGEIDSDGNVSGSKGVFGQASIAQTDFIAPTVSSITDEFNGVSYVLNVKFNEEITSASVGNESNWSLTSNSIVTSNKSGSDSTKVIILLGQALQSETTYTLTASNISDIAGNISGLLEVSFTSSDYEAPRISSVYETSTTTINVVFDQPVDDTTAGNINNYRMWLASSDYATDPVTLSNPVKLASNKYRLTNSELLSDTDYIFEASGVEDVGGSSTTDSFQFTTLPRTEQVKLVFSNTSNNNVNSVFKKVIPYPASEGPPAPNNDISFYDFSLIDADGNPELAEFYPKEFGNDGKVTKLLVVTKLTIPANTSIDRYVVWTTGSPNLPTYNNLIVTSGSTQGTNINNGWLVHTVPTDDLSPLNSLRFAGSRGNTPVRRSYYDITIGGIAYNSLDYQATSITSMDGRVFKEVLAQATINDIKINSYIDTYVDNRYLSVETLLINTSGVSATINSCRLVFPTSQGFSRIEYYPLGQTIFQQPDVKKGLYIKQTSTGYEVYKNEDILLTTASGDFNGMLASVANNKVWYLGIAPTRMNRSTPRTIGRTNDNIYDRMINTPISLAAGDTLSYETILILDRTPVDPTPLISIYSQAEGTSGVELTDTYTDPRGLRDDDPVRFLEAN